MAFGWFGKIAALLAAICLGSVAARIKKLLRQRAILRKCMPQLPNGGIFGWFPEFARPDRHRVVAKWSKQYGSMFFYRMFGHHGVVITDPAVATELLMFAPKHGGLDKATDTLKALDLVLSPHAHSGLLTTPTNEYWKAVRKGVAPAFSTANIRKGFGHTLEVIDKLTSILEAVGPQVAIDMDNAAQRESLDVIGRMGFDVDFGATTSLASKSGANAALNALHGEATKINHDEINAGIKEAMARVIDPLRWLKIYRKDVRYGNQCCKDYHVLIQNLIQDLKSKHNNGLDDTSIAAHLMAVVDPDTGKLLSKDRLNAEIAIMFLAGFETTGHTIALAIYMISQHPEVERRVLQELDSLGLLVTSTCQEPRQIAWEDLAKLTYLTNVIKEVMRILPVSSDGSVRMSTTDMKLGNYIIPAGVIMWVPFMSMFNNPEHWEHPDLFDPDRWLDGDAEFAVVASDHKGHADASKHKRFFPFSLGSRNCVGRALAQMNYLTTTAKLYSRFSFRLADQMGDMKQMREKEYMNLTLHHADGIRMHCVSRRRYI